MTSYENLILSLDPEAIRALAKIDYSDMQQIAREPGPISEVGTKIDTEMERRMDAHVSDMSPDEANVFQRIFNEEYNRLASDRIKEKMSSGCVVPIIVGLTVFSVSFTLMLNFV